ncbi:MAG: universal stress protein [Dehalococcoidia bacterium]|nr:universal stress protein [Dehalococcoidia bacterium]MDH4292264.1 universal stress protein [Dehalococcoidia bacterium]
MYKKILVALDGSKLAECALPHAEELAKGCDTTEVILVSVTERVQGYRAVKGSTEPFIRSGGGWGSSIQPPLQRLVPEAFGKKEKQAERYLGRIAEKLESKGVKVHTEVLFWPPAEAIASYAEQNGADIIVMSSHGRSGPSRWAYGSVADKVLRASCVPVLMVRAPGCVPGI